MEPLTGKNSGGAQDEYAALAGLKKKEYSAEDAANEKELQENVKQGLMMGLGAFGVFLGWIALLFVIIVLVWAFGIFK